MKEYNKNALGKIQAHFFYSTDRICSTSDVLRIARRGIIEAAIAIINVQNEATAIIGSG